MPLGMVYKSYRIRLLSVKNLLSFSNADPHQRDADPEPTCHSDADPDPTFQFDADPDLTTHFFQIWTLQRSKMTLEGFHLFSL